MQALAEFDRQIVRLAGLVKRDGFADVVHHHLAGITARHVLFKLLANGRVNRAVHVFVEHCQKFFALHGVWFRLA